jgi:hypothetical protein
MREQVMIASIRIHVAMWMQGQYPTEDAVATAPVIDQWSVGWVLMTSGKTEMRLQGVVSKRENMRDGDRIKTTEVMLLDRRTRWARTSNTLYRLGDHEGIEIPIEGVWT